VIVEDFIVILIQFVVEFVFNVLANLPFDWPSRNRATPEPASMTGIYLLWLVLGGSLAAISLLVVPRTFIVLQALRIANLVLAPAAAGLLSFAIARRRAQSNPFIVPRHHGWQAVWFTLGLVSIRFAYAIRH
jgi:hypothetical protein